jgi:hypothetical protein
MSTGQVRLLYERLFGIAEVLEGAQDSPLAGSLSANGDDPALAGD